MRDLRTCRFCGAQDFGLIKYGTRAYAHLGCALDGVGENFFEKLSDTELRNLPVFQIADRNKVMLRRFREEWARRKLGKSGLKTIDRLLAS